jgi:hypothetical protein
MDWVKEPMIQRELHQRGAIGHECAYDALLIEWVDAE